MLTYLWFTFLYQPLFNALVWIYSNVADQNLGWAVVWLTIFLRVLMLPLSIISERSAMRQEQVEAEAEKAGDVFKHDQVARAEAIRRVLKKYKVSPWAKVLMLLVQVLVLVLLYQVFMRGITGDKVIKILYSGIDFPGKLNTNFYGFEVGNFYDTFWAGVAGFYLFASTFIENRRQKVWQPSQVSFLFLFPLFTFLALWILPMVKSLFILTSMIFSDMITIIRVVFFPTKKPGS